MNNYVSVQENVLWHDAWIGLGSNLGDTVCTLEHALDALADFQQVRLVECSSFYRSAPIDAKGADFVNAVAHVQTLFGAFELLNVLFSIEQQFGRLRPYYHAPRTLDLDLLLYDDDVMATPELTLPHPAMHERAFVLLPFAELDENRVIPGYGVVKDLLLEVKDQAIMRIVDKT